MLHRHGAGLECLKNANELFAKTFLDHRLLSLVDKKLSMTQTCALAAQKGKHILGCIKSPVTRKLRERIVPLCFAMVTLHLECCIQLWDPKIRTWTVGASTVEIIRLLSRLEHFSCGDRLRESRLVSLEKRRL